MTFSQRISEEWKSRVQKLADFCFFVVVAGLHAQEIPGGPLKSDHDLAYVSFLPHDLVTGGIPHTGSRQSLKKPGIGNESTQSTGSGAGLGEGLGSQGATQNP